jgi:hypothetical protein
MRSWLVLWHWALSAFSLLAFGYLSRVFPVEACAQVEVAAPEARRESLSWSVTKAPQLPSAMGRRVQKKMLVEGLGEKDEPHGAQERTPETRAFVRCQVARLLQHQKSHNLAGTASEVAQVGKTSIRSRASWQGRASEVAQVGSAHRVGIRSRASWLSPSCGHQKSRKLAGASIRSRGSWQGRASEVAEVGAARCVVIRGRATWQRGARRPNARLATRGA